MKKNPCLLRCDTTLAVTNTSVAFWNVIVLYDSLICQCTSGMLSYCMIQWHVTTILGCDQTVGWIDKLVHFWMLSHHWHIGILLGCSPAARFTVMSVQMWDVIILYVSLICQYTFVMWLYCMFHWSVSTLLGVIMLWDSLTCKYTRGVWSYCRIHWYITTFLGCDSLVCWYTSTMLHSIASLKTAVSIIVNVGT